MSAAAGIRTQVAEDIFNIVVVRIKIFYKTNFYF